MNRLLTTLILATTIIIAGGLIAQTQPAEAPAAAFEYHVLHYNELREDLQPNVETETVIEYIGRVMNNYGSRGVRIIPLWPWFAVEVVK